MQVPPYVYRTGLVVIFPWLAQAASRWAQVSGPGRRCADVVLRVLSLVVLSDTLRCLKIVRVYTYTL